MIVNGWQLYVHPLFEEQLERLKERVKVAAAKDPAGYLDLPSAKLLATIEHHIRVLIPRDPAASEFRQGNTLGVGNKHWFRAKFHQRYRLFFRFSSREKIIVYAWVNDDSTLRKSGSKTDPYAIFRSLLEKGDPPASMDHLLRRARPLT